MEIRAIIASLLCFWVSTCSGGNKEGKVVLAEGIIFMEERDVAISNWDCHVVYKIDIGNLKQTYEDLSLAYGQLLEIIKDVKNKTVGINVIYGTFVNMANMANKYLAKYQLELSNFIREVPSRKKRGWVNLGGTVINKVFGNLDQDDLQDIMLKIERSENKTDIHLEEMILLEKGLENRLQGNSVAIKETALELANKLKQMLDRQAVDEGKLKEDFDVMQEEMIEVNALISLTIQLEEALGELKSFVRATELSVHNKLSSDLIKPQEFLSILTKVKKLVKLPYKMLKEPSFDALYIFYDLVDVNIYLDDASLNVILSVPITKVGQFFTEYKVINFPVYWANIHQFITHEVNKIFLVNKEQDEFIVGNDHLVCRGELLQICTFGGGILSLDVDCCEVDLYLYGKARLCNKLVYGQHTPQMVRIGTKVAYSFNAEEKVKIRCRNERDELITHSVIVKGSGVLNNVEACDVEASTIKISGRKHFQLMYSQALKLLNLTSFTYTKFEHTKEAPLSLNFDVVKAAVRKMGNGSTLRSYNNLIHEIESERRHNTFHIVSGGTGGLVGVSAAIVAVCAIWCCRGKLIGMCVRHKRFLVAGDSVRVEIPIERAIETSSV